MSRLLNFCTATILLLAAPLAQSGDPAKEPALVRTVADAQLQWGPCPAFIPKGCEIAVLHGDPSKPNLDVFFRVPGGFAIPSHTHTSAERMVLVSGEMDLSYEGQATTRVRTGSYLYGPAGRPHTAVCAKGAACVLFIAFVDPLDAMPTTAAKQP